MALCASLTLKLKANKAVKTVYLKENEKEDEIDKVFKKKKFNKKTPDKFYTYKSSDIIVLKHLGTWYMFTLRDSYQKVDLELNHDTIFSLAELWHLYAQKLSSELKKAS